MVLCCGVMVFVIARGIVGRRENGTRGGILIEKRIVEHALGCVEMWVLISLFVLFDCGMIQLLLLCAG